MTKAERRQYEMEKEILRNHKLKTDSNYRDSILQMINSSHARNGIDNTCDKIKKDGEI